MMKSKKKAFLAGLILCIAFAMLPMVTWAAGPSVRFVGVSGGNTSDFRVAQLIEVQTTGFAPEAWLRYSYTVGWYTDAYQYSDISRNRTSNGSLYRMNASSDSQYAGSCRFFSVFGSVARNKAVSVIVEDVNPDSPTCNLQARGKIDKFLASSLQKDVQNSDYAIYEGERLSVLALLSRAGITHITCGNCVIDSCQISGLSPADCATLDSSNYITASKSGTFNISVKIHKNRGCDFHPGNSASIDLFFKVFKKTSYSATAQTITLRKNTLEEGVTYTLNGVSKTFDGTNDIVFTDLQYATTYPLTLSYTENGRTARTETYAKTTDFYTVTFNNMGHGERLGSVRKWGSAVDETLSETGYTFLGWYDNPDGTGEDLSGTVLGKDMMLYAKWKTNTYQVIFDANGGTGSMDPMFFTYNEAQTLRLNQFTLDRHTFQHWSRSNSNKNNDAGDGASVKNLSAVDGDTVTFYAVWELNRYNIRYNTQGHGEINWSPAAEVYDEGTSIPAAHDLSEVGYDFGGWYDNAVCSGADYRTEPITRDMTLYAKWTARRYTAKVDLKLDGTAYPGQTVQLLQGGRVKYLLTGTGSVYQNTGVVMGNYDVYVGGVDSGVNISIDGTAPAGTSYTTELYAYTAKVALTKNGTPFSGQTVTLRQGGATAYTLKGDDSGVYSRELLFQDSTTREYSIFVNGQDAKTTLRVGGGSMPETAQVGYYSVTATVNLNGASWANTTVTLQSGNAIRYTMRYDGTQYSTDMVLIEKTGNTEQRYRLMVGGAFAGGDTEVDITSGNKNPTVNFYTVTFQDGSSDTVYSTQIVRSGKKGVMPVNPYREGKTFSSWSNGLMRGQPTASITAATTITANWKTPTLISGDAVRCNSAGTIASDGTCYRLGNLLLTGYPTDGTPIKQATVRTYTNSGKSTRDSSQITFVTGRTFTVSSDGTVKKSGQAFAVISGMGSSNVTAKLSGAGASAADVQAFLRSCMVVTPQSLATHTIEVRVFGATV